MEDIIYKLIPGFPGYRAGSDGSIWSCRSRWGLLDTWHRLKPTTNRDTGYLMVAIHGGPRQMTMAVHSLVLLAFVGPCPDGMEVRHLNGKRDNPRLDNLAYGTHQQNMADKISHGTHIWGEKVHFARLSSVDVLEIRRLHSQENMSLGAIARKYKRSVGNIHAIIHRRTWKYI